MLSDGASLCYTSLHPESTSNLRSYLLHRLYAPVISGNNPVSTTTTPTLTATATANSSRFPFVRRANVLDRERLLVPTGWDSWGKIKVVREGFDPKQAGQQWEISLERVKKAGRVGGGGGNRQEEVYIEDESDVEGPVEKNWNKVMPDVDRDDTPFSKSKTLHQNEPEQSFLSRQLDSLRHVRDRERDANLMRDPTSMRDPRRLMRQQSGQSSSASASASSFAPNNSSRGQENDDATNHNISSDGIIGPVSTTGGTNLPAVEQAFNSMSEHMIEKQQQLQPAASSTSTPRETAAMQTPVQGSKRPTAGAESTTSNEVLNNFVSPNPEFWVLRPLGKGPGGGGREGKERTSLHFKSKLLHKTLHSVRCGVFSIWRT